MSALVLQPGRVPLEDWRSIYRGAEVRLDAGCAPAIEASARAVDAIVARGEPVYGINTGFGKLASVRIEAADLAKLQYNIVLSHAAGVGEPAPPAVVRLMLALKLASLARGASGVRPATIAMLEAMLANGLLPVVPSQGSVGASGDLAPLAHMAAAMIGVGDVDTPRGREPAADCLRRHGLAPLALGPKEGLALLNGTQFSTAYALAALFALRELFQAALITGVLSTEAAKGSDAPFDARIHALRGHQGQIACADALRGLMAGSAIRASHLVGDDRVQDPYCLRCQPQVMGAVLDVLQQASRMLAVEANGVSDNPLIIAEEGIALSGGNFHAEPVAFAADMMALAICETGSLAERRIAMLVDPALSRLPAFLTPRAGLNSGFMVPQVTAAALVSENKQRAHPASVDSIPTSANQEDHVSMAAHAARRLLPMAENLTNILAIELLAGCQGCDFHAPLLSSAALEGVRGLLRADVAHLDDDRHMAVDIDKAARLVRSGALAEARGCRCRRFGDGDPSGVDIPGLGPGIQPSASAGTCGTMDPGDPDLRRGRRAPGWRRRARRMATERPGWLTVERREAPLIVSFPHTGTEIPGEIEARCVSAWLARKDADWWIDQLYAFVRELDATIVHTAISRTVIDVNRDPSGVSLYLGQATTELVPSATFDGEPLWKPGQAPDTAEIARRREAYFAPYHDALTAEIARLRGRHPSVVLYDCHSIRSVIPRLFDGTLPVMNIGTNAGASCDPALETPIARIAAASPFSHIVNGRFKGGYITRRYGAPAAGVQAVQMELACRGYVNEPIGRVDQSAWPAPYYADYAAPIQRVLRAILETCLRYAKEGTA